jgi:uncharacterized DUF497 family protein
MQFTFDPRKDAANIAKHGLSLLDAPLVLVYVLREPNEVRAISLRCASKQERALYAQNKH